ncbi:hypothetical protein NP233_g7100 [Leucocoprinus birnbaumii]|uniref:Uncharacterized protein n=1 Tax=Leucocoprinus birnbaumii TaxID=56174 RepID=A0AAD5VPU8_9AGAR|nr:hypothetical protein NP233_g7100 [Leucocoprinus birnbaumii]
MNQLLSLQIQTRRKSSYMLRDSRAHIALRCCDVTGVSPVLDSGALKAEGNGVRPSTELSPRLTGSLAAMTVDVNVDVEVAVHEPLVKDDDVDMDYAPGRLGGARRKLESEDPRRSWLRIGPDGS